jgi:hypothetical protein
VNVLRPGPGVVGHCISVDPWFLVESAPEETDLIRQARMVNDRQPARVAARLAAALGGLRGKSIAALGLTYKADVDDMSPALEVVRRVAEAGATVRTYRPRPAATANSTAAASLNERCRTPMRRSCSSTVAGRARSCLGGGEDAWAGRVRAGILPRDLWQQAGFTVFVPAPGRAWEGPAGGQSLGCLIVAASCPSSGAARRLSVAPVVEQCTRPGSSALRRDTARSRSGARPVRHRPDFDLDVMEPDQALAP